MSTDMVDELHAAEDRADRYRATLDRIWEALQIPFEWSADTPETVCEIMHDAGWRQVDEDHAMIRAEYEHDAGSVAEVAERWPRIAAAARRDHTPPREHRLACEDHDIDDDDADLAGYCGCWCHYE